jgi:hypothetical protein
MKSFNNRLDQSEEIISPLEDKVDELAYSDINKEKNRNMQNLWDAIKIPNLHHMFWCRRRH